jgi:DNA repair protein RadC
MRNTKRSIKANLKYRVPRFKLALVAEGLSAKTLTAVRTPDDAAAFLEPLKHAPEEYFVTLHLNTRHEVIGLHEVSHGTISSSLVHPREVFKAAILSNAYAIIVCHNHPSGSSIFPSREDIDTTKQLLSAGELLGVSVVDHLIVGPGQEPYSLRERHPELWPL